MEKLMHVIPSIEHKEQAIGYIKEHLNYNSNINGSGGLDRYIDNYENWLKKIESDRVLTPNKERVPAETYFLVRKNDNKIIGMINIRLTLNERLLKCGGHIGYGIRPTERRKGYNKINLYLALKRCQELGIDMVLLDCDKENIASYKTMEALGGTRINEYYNKDEKCVVLRYSSDVLEAINNYEIKLLQKKYNKGV